MILVVYDQMPLFPATDQHPDAQRHYIGGFVVDAIGPPPSEAEITTFIAPPPHSVSRLQARVALHRAGLLPQIEAAIAQANGELQIYWTDAQVFERDSTYIAQIAAAIGLTGEQVDQLFRDAATVG